MYTLTDNDQLKLKKISTKKSEPNYRQENKSCSCTKLHERKKFKVQSGMQGVKGIMLR